MPLIDPGKQYKEFLTTSKKPADERSIKSSYLTSGLNKRLGDWRGTSQQYNAMLNLGKAEQSVQDITAKTSALRTMVGQAGSIAKAGFPVDNKTDIAPTPEFSKLYPDLGQTKEGQLRFNPETGTVEKLTNKQWLKETAPEVAKPEAPIVEPKESASSPEKVITTTPDVIQSVQLSDVDIGNIINEIEGGTATTPETVIGGEQAKLLKEQETAKTAEALTKFQEGMAKAGMTFSGIRTAGEAKIAAESLARQSGIELDLAEKIVDAARREQTNRIKAIQDSQEAQRKSLESMGYVSFGGQLYKTTERERLEKEPAGQALPTSYKEYELSQESPEYAKFLEDRKSNDLLNMIRGLTLQQMQGEYKLFPGQIYSKATGKAATDESATFIEKLISFKSASDSVVPKIQYLLEQPDVNVEAFLGWFKQFGYQGWGRFLGLSGTATDNEKRLMRYMNELNNEYLYARSGAQINEREAERLGTVMPRTGFSNKDNISRLADFESTLKGIINDRLNLKGLAIYGQEEDSNNDYQNDWKLFKEKGGNITP